MYHSVTRDETAGRGLTISESKLEAQFKYLKETGYTSLHFGDLQKLQSLKDFPEKAIIITFDDAYVNQLELAYPLLKRYKLKACFYVPLAYVGGTDAWDGGLEAIMNQQQLKSLDSEIIELGLHSFKHSRYTELDANEIQKDFDYCRATQEQLGLKMHHSLAFPYGSYYKKGLKKKNFIQLLKQNNIDFAMRIGNKVNAFPFKNNYRIKRLGIKGEDSLEDFKRKIKKGKSWF